MLPPSALTRGRPTSAGSEAPSHVDQQSLLRQEIRSTDTGHGSSSARERRSTSPSLMNLRPHPPGPALRASTDSDAGMPLPGGISNESSSDAAGNQQSAPPPPEPQPELQPELEHDVISP
jgi:hypothetical protein